MPEQQFEWLDQRPSTVAWRLLGAELVVGNRRGRIVEVEAYEGVNDPASHAFGRITDRNRIMHGPVGRLYVYRSYGIHWCANIVCHSGDGPGAILVRAIEPLGGIEAMRSDRPKARGLTDLGSGPGKTCAALAITGADNGCDLLDPQSRVRLVASTAVASPEIVTGFRVGITKGLDKPWRFAIADNPNVSYPRP